jgi:hypothetical protein
LHYDRSIADPTNAEGVKLALPLFRCPSDNDSNSTFQWEGDEPGAANIDQLATANYLGVFGTTDVHECENVAVGKQCIGNGVFYHNSTVRFDDIRDGLSQTFAAGERKLELDLSTWVGAPPGDGCSPGLVVGTALYVPNSPSEDAHNFGSHHAQGTHFLLGDGSVRLISELINVNTYRALATRDNGDIPGDY